MHPYKQFEAALRLLDGRLALADAPSYRLVVCGGTAPLPPPLVSAAAEVADDLGLSRDWLNNGPSSGDGGLYRLGLPQGLAERLSWTRFGDHLAVGFISRFDQIHFKLYAAVDQFGSYHATDLQALRPTDEELIEAATRSRSHDPSPGYRENLRAFLGEFGYEHLVDRV